MFYFIFILLYAETKEHILLITVVLRVVNCICRRVHQILIFTPIFLLVYQRNKVTIYLLQINSLMQYFKNIKV